MIDQDKPRTDTDPYHMSPERAGTLENELLAHVNARTDRETVHAVWLPQESEYADLIRTLECEKFPEIADVMRPFEKQSVFLALVDNRPEVQRIVHAFRLTSLSHADMEIPEGDTTGVALLDDIIDSDQDLTASEVKDYYEKQGIDLAKCVSVETNFRVGEKVKVEDGLPVSQKGYLAIFRELERGGVHEGNAAVFAHLNRPAVSSLGMAGVEYGPLAGREDLQTPTVTPDGQRIFDDKYRPVAIIATSHNVQVFQDLMPFAAPEVSV